LAEILWIAADALLMSASSIAALSSSKQEPDPVEDDISAPCSTPECKAPSLSGGHAPGQLVAGESLEEPGLVDTEGQKGHDERMIQQDVMQDNAGDPMVDEDVIDAEGAEPQEDAMGPGEVDGDVSQGEEETKVRRDGQGVRRAVRVIAVLAGQAALGGACLAGGPAAVAGQGVVYVARRAVRGALLGGITGAAIGVCRRLRGGRARED
jgi:hypothetical protein